MMCLHTGLSAQGDLGRMFFGLVIGAVVLLLITLVNIGFAGLLKKTYFHQKVIIVTVLLFLAALGSGLITWYVDMSIAVGAFLSGAVMAWSGIAQKFTFPKSVFERIFSVATPVFFLAIGLQITAVSIASQPLWNFLSR